METQLIETMIELSTLGTPIIWLMIEKLVGMTKYMQNQEVVIANNSRFSNTHQEDHGCARFNLHQVQLQNVYHGMKKILSQSISVDNQ